jgi:hypothetical protein
MQCPHAPRHLDGTAFAQWYAENQRLLTENDELIRQQAEAIRSLQAQLVTTSAPGARKQAARVKELEQQVRLTLRRPSALARGLGLGLAFRGQRQGA